MVGPTSQVVVSSGRSSSTAQVRLPLSEALSGSSALSVHCGVMHSSELAPVHLVRVRVRIRARARARARVRVRARARAMGSG